MLIGVISDTHGLLRPEVFTVFEDVDLILHAGDVGREEILVDLSSLAPVVAVTGNVDGFALAERLPESRTVDAEQIKIFMTHICGSPSRLRTQFQLAREADVVIFGHTHKPVAEDHFGALFFNPGSAGPRRFRLPVTVGRLRVDGQQVSSEIVTLLD